MIIIILTRVIHRLRCTNIKTQLSLPLDLIPNPHKYKMDSTLPNQNMSNNAKLSPNMNRIRRHKPSLPAHLKPPSPAPATQASPSNQTNRTGNQKYPHRRFKNPNRSPWLEDDLKQLHRKLVKTPTSHHVIRDNVHTAPPVSSRPVPDDAPYHLSRVEDQETAGKQAGIDGIEIEEMRMQEAWAQRQLGKFVRRFCVLRADFKRVKDGWV